MADPTPFYYVAGTVASVVGALAGANTYWKRQRKQWVDEGVERARNAEALDSNTKAAEANTKAIASLSKKIDEFAYEVREDLRQFGQRVDRLENNYVPGTRIRQQPRQGGGT